jgi:hypothetical protein
MNVNLWGPNLWEILHGLSWLSQSSQSNKHLFDILDNLNILLPCIYCRQSFHQFFKKEEARSYLELKNEGPEYVYLLHSKVNDKLESQKFTEIFSSFQSQMKDQNVYDEMQKKFISFHSRTPSFEVVRKRWLLSEGEPFSEKSVWKTLFVFMLALNLKDNDVSSSMRRMATYNFILALFSILSKDNAYIKYGKLTQKLYKLLTYFPNFAFDAKQGFYVVAAARNFKIKENITEDNIEMLIMNNQDINELWNLYNSTVPAKCKNNSCV